MPVFALCFVIALLLPIMGTAEPVDAQCALATVAACSNPCCATQPCSATAAICPASPCVSATSPVQVTAQVVPGGVPPAQPIQHLEIKTDGVAAIFINSNVNIEGNTITNTVNAPVPTQAAQAAANGAKPTEAAKKEEPTPYDKLIENATKTTGLLTVWEKEDHLYWEIPPERLNVNLLAQAKLSTGLGVGGLYPGRVLDEAVLQLERDGKKVHIKAINVRLRALDESSPLHRAVERAFTDSIVASLPVAATNPANDAPVVDIRSYLLSDFMQLANAVNGTVGSGYSVDSANCDIESYKVFPENLQTRINYQFTGGKSDEPVLPDGRSLSLTMLYSIRTLPNTDYVPRPADDRVGYFLEAFEDYTSTDPRTRFVRYITAFNIKKASPELELSTPREPLTIWIENTVPEEYRTAVKEGVLYWNAAFEAIGIKDAIACHVMSATADWDPEDVRYNVVHWNTSRDSSFAGLAQWSGNPFTGEILDFDVLLEGEVIRNVERRRPILDPDSMAKLEAKPHDVHACSYGPLLAQECQAAMTVLRARGEIRDATDVHRFIHEYIVELTAHEVGHCLGLRHNFKASTLHPFEVLSHKEITDREGLVSSVMDYNPVNLAPEGVEQGSYFPTSMGPYDRWAIAYGYTPLSATTTEGIQEELQSVAAKAANPALAYGTDEDLWYQGGRNGIDPSIEWFDYAQNPMDYHQNMFEIAAMNLPKIPEIIESGEGYYDARFAVGLLLGQYSNSAQKVARFIGGQYMNRAPRVGRPETGLPLQVVPVSEQRRALKLLADYVFSDERLQFKPELLNMLLQEKYYHWGSEPPMQTEYPFHQILLGIRSNVLNQLLDNVALSRIVDGETKVAEGEEALSLPEYFNGLLEAVWGPELALAEAKTHLADSYTNGDPLISSHRRSLQRLMVDRMVKIMLSPDGQGQVDAKVHAWDVLQRLNGELKKLLDRSEQANVELDAYSSVHVRDIRETIARALDAKFSLRVD